MFFFLTSIQYIITPFKNKECLMQKRYVAAIVAIVVVIAFFIPKVKKAFKNYQAVRAWEERYERATA